MEVGMLTGGSGSDLEIESEIWILAHLCFPITVTSGIGLGGER
jgi:hypothetical protein